MFGNFLGSALGGSLGGVFQGAAGSVLSNALIGGGLGYAFGGKKGLGIGMLGGGLLGTTQFGQQGIFGAPMEQLGAGQLSPGGATWFNSLAEQQSANIANTGNVGVFANQAGIGSSGIGSAGMYNNNFLLGKGLEAGLGLYQAQGAKKVMEGQLALQQRQQALSEEDYNRSKERANTLSSWTM